MSDFLLFKRSLYWIQITKSSNHNVNLYIWVSFSGLNVYIDVYQQTGSMKAYEFLLEKGINKVHQPNKRYNLTVYELITFLEEFSQKEKAMSYNSYEFRAFKNIS